MSFTVKLDKLIAYYDELRETLATHTMGNPAEFAKLSKEFSDMTPIVEAITALRMSQRDLVDMDAMLKDSSLDPDMKAMVNDEYFELKEKIPALEQAAKVLLLPKDANDERNVILEVRAGTGGEEAGLFAANSFDNL